VCVPLLFYVFQVLDFDFEKFCSVSLSNLNVYACLVCGKYYQGRGKKSHAYTHSLEAGHHVYINLRTEQVYCLPDGYEIDDPSLDDIRHVLNQRCAYVLVTYFYFISSLLHVVPRPFSAHLCVFVGASGCLSNHLCMHVYVCAEAYMHFMHGYVLACGHTHVVTLIGYVLACGHTYVVTLIGYVCFDPCG